MKTIKILAAILLAVSYLAAPLPGLAEDKNAGKPKPYPLDKCLVTDEKLDADPGMKTFVFVHEGQEIKLCCKSCLKGFKKDPAKYMKKLKDAETAAKKK